jgi:phosphoglycerate dehydrogenase-like enzyme
VATAWLPYDTRDEVLGHLGTLPSGIEVDVYTGDGHYPASIADLEFYVLPYMTGPGVLERAREMRNLKVVQTLTAGYEEFLPRLPPGAVLCNAAGVHDASTAELAIALTLASGRGLDDYARRQSERSWRPHFGTALADSRVLIIGYGNIGRAIEKRLAGFEPASVARVARTARPGPPAVHSIADLQKLLPHTDVAILIAPHTPETESLISARELSLLPDGALLVNVSRGRLVDIDALVGELGRGRIRAALDVVDPEPLPPSHPLWSSPNTIITPHVGGMSSAFRPRADALIAEQLRRFVAREPLMNVVAPLTVQGRLSPATPASQMS